MPAPGERISKAGATAVTAARTRAGEHDDVALGMPRTRVDGGFPACELRASDHADRIAQSGSGARGPWSCSSDRGSAFAAHLHDSTPIETRRLRAMATR